MDYWKLLLARVWKMDILDIFDSSSFKGEKIRCFDF